MVPVMAEVCKISMLTAFAAMSTSYLGVIPWVLKQAGLCLVDNVDWASQILFNVSSSGQFLTQGIPAREQLAVALI